MALAMAKQGHCWLAAQFTCKTHLVQPVYCNIGHSLIALTLPPVIGSVPAYGRPPLRRYRAVGMLYVTKL